MPGPPPPMGPARNPELPHPPDAGVVLHGGIVQISSSRQQRVLFCTPSGSQQGQAVLLSGHLTHSSGPPDASNQRG